MAAAASHAGGVGLSSPRTWLVRLLWFAIILTLIVAFLVGGGAVWLRQAMRASLPQVEGEAHTAAVMAPVTVRRDGHGVPHIEASTMDDLIAAQGYVTAQDRLWQMDMIRRMAAGEAAELLGAALLPHDRMQRVLLFRPTAERLAASLQPRDRRFFEDYARGVNAYIAENSGHLPAEFRVLGYKPRPWQPVDSILVALSMIQTLDEQWQTKLSREHIEARLGPTLAADLYPTGSWRDHPPTQSTPDLTQPERDVPKATPEQNEDTGSGGSISTALFGSAEDLLQLEQLAGSGLAPDIRCRGCQPGSNEWAVAGKHTASGRPLMSNDMHLTHQVPNIWYETDLRAGTFHVTGVTVPGAPFIIAGHNEHIAWGFTALYGDVQDVYVERTNTAGDYWANGGWHAMEHERETIRVRWRHDEHIDVLRTDHGPVITPLLPHERRTLSLKWTGYEPGVSGVPLYDLDAAANWSDFRNAMSQWWAPTLNVIYADDAGHIGYQAAALIPLRPDGLRGTPVPDDASAPNHEWQGAIPFAQLPSVLDPPNGILATANARITPDGSPLAMSLEWASPYRNERIWKWLAGKDGLRPADMLTLQTDIYSELDHELAQRFAYAIDHAQKRGDRLRRAADLLRTWDGVLGINSPAAAVLTAAKGALWPLVLGPKLGDDWKLYEWPASAFAEEQLITNASPQWLPSGYPSWNDLLAAAVDQGLTDLHANADLKGLEYGDVHTIGLSHPLFGRLPFFGFTAVGPLPQSGDTTTVKQVGSDFGPSQRFTMDWSDPDRSTENVVLGQSGDPLSAHYKDQWHDWYNGTTFALPFSEDAVRAATAHTLQLIP
ncbi:MAG: penicillin acylase family protein [Acidobacteriaceae bacterium]